MRVVQKVGRPLGVVAEKVLEALAKQPMTTVQLAHSLQATTKMMSDTCYRLVLRKRIRVIGWIRIPQCCKSIPIYSLVREINPDKMHEIIWGK